MTCLRMNGAGMTGVGMGVDATGSAVGVGIGSRWQAIVPAATTISAAHRIDLPSLRFIGPIQAEEAVGDWSTTVANPGPH